MPYDEGIKSKLGNKTCSHYEESLEGSRQFRERYKKQKGVVKAEEMPWENSRQGCLKHILNEKLDTREYCVDIYQQFLEPGSRSGKHRHLTEEVLYILEGKGYDLHWDVIFDCQEEYSWDWAKEPKKFEWKEGDFVYIPPYVTHQHFNADPNKPARFISSTSRIVKAMGLDWLEQVEDAPEYKGK